MANELEGCTNSMIENENRQIMVELIGVIDMYNVVFVILGKYKKIMRATIVTHNR